MASALEVARKAISKVRGKRELADQQRLTSRSELIRAIVVDGHNPTEAEIETLVDDLDAFEADIKRHEERFELSKLVATGGEKKAEADKLYTERMRRKAEWDQKAAAFDAVQRESYNAEMVVRKQLDCVERAKKRMVELADPDPREQELKAKRKAVGRESAEVQEVRGGGAYERRIDLQRQLKDIDAEEQKRREAKLVF